MAPYALLQGDALNVLIQGPASHWLTKRLNVVHKPSHPDGLILESWAQGYMVGSLIIMAALTIANMRRGILLHKLILLELILGTFHGTFIFAHEPAYGWYLSTTAIFLNISWSLHNVIAWIKTKPFLSRKWSLFYIGTVILAQPYWVLEIYANFTYFNTPSTLFETTRPYEALFRDPWWIFSTLNLFYNIRTTYRLPLSTILTLSPRFAVLLTAMTLSICFIIVDIVAVTSALNDVLPDGLNPFWKLAFVFKCLTDSIVLDDFKTALDRLMRFKMRREGVEGGVEGTLGATVGDPDNDRDNFRSGNGGSNSSAGMQMIGTDTAAQDGFGKPANQARGAPAQSPLSEQDDPLGERMIDRQRLDDAQDQAACGAHERSVPGCRACRAERGADRGRNEREIGFWEALNEGGELEKNAAARDGNEQGDRQDDEKGMTQHVEHWDDMELPEFETSTSSRSSSGEERKKKGQNG